MTFNQIINISADAIYILDLFINFRTTVFDELTNDEIFEAKLITQHYIKNRFLIDLIASIPFDIILSDHENKAISIHLKIFSILKMVRILRFTKVIIYLNATQSFKLSLKLFKLIFYLVVYLHIQACAWFFYTK